MTPLEIYDRLARESPLEPAVFILGREFVAGYWHPVDSDRAKRSHPMLRLFSTGRNVVVVEGAGQSWGVCANELWAQRF